MMQIPTIDLSTLNQQYDPTALVVLFIIAIVALGTPMTWLIIQLARAQSKDRAASSRTTDGVITLLGTVSSTFAQNTAAISALTDRLSTFLERNAASVANIQDSIAHIKDDSAALKVALLKVETSQSATRIRIDEIADTATVAIDALKADLEGVKVLLQTNETAANNRHAALENVVNNMLVLVQAIRNDLSSVVSRIRIETEEIPASA